MESKTNAVDHVEALSTISASVDNNVKAAQYNTKVEHEMSLREAVRLYPMAIVWVVIFSLSIIMEGYDIGLVPNLWAQPAFKRNYGALTADGTYELEAYHQSLLQGMVQAGSICGYALSGIVIDVYGHRKTLLAALFSVVCFVFMVFFSPSIGVLIAAQGLLGLPWGIIQTLTTTYASELAPTPLRPILTTYVCMCWMIGGFISTGILRGFVDVSSQWGYRIPFAIQWIWPIPIAIGVIFAPDSPWWLVRVGRQAEARKALLRLTSRKHTDYDVDAVVAMIAHTIRTESANGDSGTYKACFQGTNRRRTEITCVAGAVPFLAGSSFGGLVIYFLSSAGLAPSAAYNVGLGMTGVNLLAVASSWFLVSKFGRRSIYLTCLGSCVILLGLVGILGCLPESNVNALWATGGIMILYSAIYMAGLGAIAYVVVSEVPASLLRNKTIAIARIFLNVLNFAGSWLNPQLINPSAANLRGKGAFVWMGFAFLTLVWTFLRMPETKDRTYGELDDLFHRGVPTREFKGAIAHVAAEDETIPEAVHEK